jgi:hypothetical protein
MKSRAFNTSAMHLQPISSERTHNTSHHHSVGKRVGPLSSSSQATCYLYGIEIEIVIDLLQIRTPKRIIQNEAIQLPPLRPGVVGLSVVIMGLFVTDAFLQNSPVRQ